MKVHLGVYRETGRMFKVRNTQVKIYILRRRVYAICNLVFISERMLYVRCAVSYEYHNRQTDKSTQI